MMNEMMSSAIVETMTSKQITDLLNEGKPKEDHVRHDNVKRTMERLQDRGVISFTPMEDNPAGVLGGRPGTMYSVNEDDSYTVVAQLSPEFTAAIVKAWRHLAGEYGVSYAAIEKISIGRNWSHVNL